MTGTLMLVALVRADVAKELVFTARVFDGREAFALGLATRLSDTPFDDAMAMAREIAGRSPDAVRGAKASAQRPVQRRRGAAVRRGAPGHRVAGRPPEPDRGGDGQLREARPRTSSIPLSRWTMTIDPDRSSCYSLPAVHQARGRGHRGHGPPRRPARAVRGDARGRHAADDHRAGRRSRAARALGPRVGATTRPRPS